MPGKISIEVIADTNTNNVSFRFSGSEEREFTETDLKLFNVTEESLKDSFKYAFLGKIPNRIYYGPPALSGNRELYSSHRLTPLAKVITVKSVRLLSLVKKPVIVCKQDFDNYSTWPIKVNTGLSKSVNNTLKTSWSNKHSLVFDHNFEYNVGYSIAKLNGTAKMNYTRNWGSSKDKTEDVTIGTTSGAETDLPAGQGITATLTSNTVEIEVEVTYSVSLKYNLVAICDSFFSPVHIYMERIDDILERCGVRNEATIEEVMKFNCYFEGSLTVHNRVLDVQS